MNNPHTHEFFLLQGFSLEEEAMFVLAVADNHDTLIELVKKIAVDFPGAFDAYKITSQGGVLTKLAEAKAGRAAPTHAAPNTRS